MKTLPICAVPLLADIPIALLVLLILGNLPNWALSGLHIAGGLFILYLAWRIVKLVSVGGVKLDASETDTHRTFFAAIIIIFLNPNPYIVWSSVMGPTLLRAWAQSYGHVVSYLVGFYVIFIGGLCLWVIVFDRAGQLSPTVSRGLFIIAGMALIILGLFQLWLGMTSLW